MSYTTIITEGGLLPADLLDSIATGDTKSQDTKGFGIDKNRRMSDAIAATWGEVRAYWDAAQKSLTRLGEDDSTTRITRERWIIPMLDALGYTDLAYMPTAARVENRTYAISHRAGQDESAPPVHIEGFGSDLDSRPPSGRPRLSPHGLLQEYLNSTEHLWGIVTNGERLRLLRDSSQISRPRYVEFDLRSMMEGEKFNEFALLYRLLHRSRLPRTDADAKDCLLEHYHQEAVESGGRVREGLREGVEEALKVLGNGLLQHPKNAMLREKLAMAQIKPIDFYRQLLKLVYRLLFLMVAEERRLIAVSEDEVDQFSPLHYRAPKDERLRIYLDHYSVGRLRRLAEQPGAGRAPYDDLWLNLQTTFRLFEGSDERGAQMLGLSPLNGDLFGEYAIQDLINTHLRNPALLQAIRALSLYRDQQNKVWRRVNYSALDVEELGSVYESLLDYRPVIVTLGQNNRLSFELVTGTERKTTGSYYTRPELVQELIKSALEPVIEERLKSAMTQEQQEQVLLGITVCDPACGSGHFLLAAARRLGRELAKVRSGEEQPTPSEFRKATRDVVAHCIYGVDLNPLAVDLCKLALWIEGHNGGMPLSFLDHHIKWGNSLVGATRELVEQGILDDAYKPVTGDEKPIASAIKKRNKQEREAWQKGSRVQEALFADQFDYAAADLAAEAAHITDMRDDSVKATRAKAERYRYFRDTLAHQLTHFNLWTAAFFQPLTSATVDKIPTTKTLLDWQHNQAVGRNIVGAAEAFANEVHFFHYELEFPEVFKRGGFDVVLGNPPWERIKLQEEEFFSSHDLEIARAQNKAARQRLINQLPQTNPDLGKLFQKAKHTAEAQSRFVRESGRFPLTAVGDVNTYALFTEHARSSIKGRGRAGIIVPTGIATDDTTKTFFGDLVNKKSLVSYFGFKNERFLFAKPVEHTVTFGLLTMLGEGQVANNMEFTWLAYTLEHMNDPKRRLFLSPDEILLLNPNTGTCPVFRTRIDADLTKKIYYRVPVLVNDRLNFSPWGTSFMRMFDMSNDSHLFQSQPCEGLLPLYEAKLLHQFTHRWATYDGIDTREFTHAELIDPDCKITPRYWVAYGEVEARLETWTKNWLLAFRRVARTTDERTGIFSILPATSAGDSIFFLLPVQSSSALISCLLTTLNSLVFDYVIRQKVGGVNFNFFIVKQLPVLPPSTFSTPDIVFISERVLELVYTTWDMQPFAQDVWTELDEAGRQRVLARNAECNRDAPTELFAPRDGSPLPPFRWNKERRARIRAELDARIARLYGLTRDELRYILDPADVYGQDFPSETFRVLKEKEIKQYGEYRTRRLVLEAWDKEHGV